MSQIYSRCISLNRYEPGDVAIFQIDQRKAPDPTKKVESDALRSFGLALRSSARLYGLHSFSMSANGQEYMLSITVDLIPSFHQICSPLS
jgi:hypothetical protein